MFRGKRKGIGTALWWLNGHRMLLGRYLDHYYPIHDWKMMTNFFYQNSKEAMTILDDFSKSNDDKIESIIKELSFGKSKIVIIVGARGGGKTALSMFLINELHKKEEQETFYFVAEGIPDNVFPSWIKVVPEIEKVPDGSFAIIDEASLKYSARRFMEDENVLISGLVATARHHDLTILFICQHLGLIDLNIFRMRDLIFYLRSSDYEIGERGGKTTTVYKGFGKVRTMMAPREQGECLFENPSYKRFIHFNFELPEFWSIDISKVFKGYNAKEKLIRERFEKIKSTQDTKLEFLKRKSEIQADAYIKRGLNPQIKQEKKEGRVPDGN